ncbi:MAG: anthranilate phosphoribosyltransferase [Candidatus Bathyarchaeia archaeon]
MIVDCIKKVVEGINLSYQEAYGAMKEIMTGKATPAQIAAFITALRMKGETVEEISAFASAMRELCIQIRPNVNGRLIDTCGTGGDKIKTFNVSTLAAFIVAGAGVPVAKHGNRSITSMAGSADLLERLGLKLNVGAEEVQKSIEEIGIGFIYAPNFHPAMKYAIGPRKEIAIRTVFNILGPLVNPANVRAQLLGVFDRAWLEPMAWALRNLGCEEAIVVHGLDGLDEISIVGKTAIAWLKGDEIKTFEVTPRGFGLEGANPLSLMVSSLDECAEIAFKLLYCKPDLSDPKLRMLIANSSAALVVGGKADNFKDGIELALESIASGSAYKKLKSLIKFYGGSLSTLEEMERRYG